MAPRTKLTELAELLAEHEFGSVLILKGQHYYYIVDETNSRITYSCHFDTLYTQTKRKINSPAIFTELIDSGTLRTFNPNRIPYCQTNDIEDVKNILTEDKKFIHIIDEADEFTAVMINKIGAMFSPSMVAFFKDIRKPFIYLFSIDQLRDHSFDKQIEFMSPRGYRNVIEASKIRKNKLSGFSDAELKLLDMAEIELKFEEVRREECDWAPSRLSAIYLMDYSQSSADNMATMFKNTIRKDPKVIIVQTAGIARIIKVDYRWFEQYTKDRNTLHIRKYWQSKPFEYDSDTWEYLHEGGLFPLEENYEPYR